MKKKKKINLYRTIFLNVIKKTSITTVTLKLRHIDSQSEFERKIENFKLYE